MTHQAESDAVIEKNSDGIYDFNIDEYGDIESKDSLDTALLMTLFCEQRASDSEMPASHLRRGWIGNEYTPGFEIGSKLWLFEQARLSRSTLNDLLSASRNALQWLIDDGLASSLSTSIELDGNANPILVIDIKRPNSKITRKYNLWENTGI